MAINTKAYIESYLKIVDKGSHLIPFKLNKPQQRLYDTIKQRAKDRKPLLFIILKARQMGFSTFVEAIGFKTTATEQNVKMSIVTHEEKATKNLYDMTRRYYENLPDVLKPETDSYTGYGLKFAGLNSSVTLYTAGGKGIGRSATINFLHCSELAFFPGDPKNTLDGLLQAVPDTEDAMVFLESTPNGFNHFYDLWDAAKKGENDYVPFFAAWHEMDEYRRNADGFIINENITRYGDEQLMKDLYGLDNEQLAWRRFTIDNKLSGDLEKFKQEYPSNDLECFLFSGESVFNNEAVINRIEEAKKDKPLRVGNFKYKYKETKEEFNGQTITNNVIDDETIKFVEDERGTIRIYEEPIINEYNRGTEYAPYVIGGDTSGTGEDYFTANVINNMTLEEAATYHIQNIDEALYAEQVYCLGKYYNDAVIGLEVNYSTYPTRRLMELGARQYTRQNMDTVGKVSLDSLGFKTTAITRPVIIEQFKNIIREDMRIVKDLTTLGEMLTFVKDDKGKAQAQEGKHDDMIMARMIAGEISKQQKRTMTMVEKEHIDVIEQFFGRSKRKTKGGISKW